MGTQVANKPSFVEHGSLKFLIIDAPTDVNVEAYIREFKSHNVTDLVRACECGYDGSRIVKAGVNVHDLPFPDGEAPPDDIIKRWLELCNKTFAKSNPDDKAIGIHCESGTSPSSASACLTNRPCAHFCALLVVLFCFSAFLLFQAWLVLAARP